MANYTWTGATSSDWGTNTNWLPTTSTAGVGPTTGDNVTFNGTSSVNCTTGSTTRNCLTINTTGYTGVLTVGTAANLGYIQVGSNITFGSQPGHIAGLSYIGIVGATCLLDVAAGFTIPYLAFGSLSGAGGACTVTLARSFAVTKIVKTGLGGSTATVTAGSAMNINLTNGSISGSILSMAANVTLSINGSCDVAVGGFTYSGNMTLAAGSTLTLLATLSFGGTATFNCSAGNFVPGVQSVALPNAFVTINMGTTNSFYNLGGGGGIGMLVTMLSPIVITNNFTPSGTSQMNGAFDITIGGNIIATGTLSNSSAGRKITLTGITTGVSSITSFTSGSFKLEINCVNRGFTLTGALSVLALDYLATNTGSFTTTGSTLTYNQNLSINMNGSTNSWNILASTTGLAPTLTLLSDVHCNTLGPVGNTDKINGPLFSVVTTGSTGTISNVSGTGGIKFIGAVDAIWNQNVGTTNAVARIEFAKTGLAKVTMPNNFVYAGTMTYTSGVVVPPTTLTLGNTVLVNTTTIPWNNITVNAAATITIN
jgi:hypothetical protein